MTASTLGKLISYFSNQLYSVIFSFDKESNKCYLKSGDAATADSVYNTKYQTTMEGCADSSCVLEVLILTTI